MARTEIPNRNTAELTQEQRRQATQELKKFFQLVNMIDVEKYKMFSGAVDAVWHELLKDPDAYAAFREEAGVVENIGHMPGSGFGVIQWIQDYHQRYGKLTPIWFTDASGVLDEKSYNAYLSTDVVVAAWDCGVMVPVLE